MSKDWFSSDKLGPVITINPATIAQPNKQFHVNVEPIYADISINGERLTGIKKFSTIRARQLLDMSRNAEEFLDKLKNG